MTDLPIKPRILVASDDPSSLDAIARIARKDERLDVHQAASIREGERFAQQLRPDLIVCHYHPHEECLKFLQSVKVAAQFPFPMLLFLWDGSEVEEIEASYEHGADDYIEKSLCPALLGLKIGRLVHTKRLHEELAEEERRLEEANQHLERNFNELTGLLLKMLEVRIPGAEDRAESAKTLAEFITSKLEISTKKRAKIVFAARLHEIGKIGLPDEVTCKHLNTLPGECLPVFQQYTTVGSAIVSGITGYKESAEAVYHQLENYDGTGFPDTLMGQEIPIGARVLRAIVFYEELLAEGFHRDSIIERIRPAMHSALEQRMANLLIEFLLQQNNKADASKIKVHLDDLEAGMTAAEDVYAASGIKLLHKGTVIQDKMLALIRERNATDPIIGGVYVVNT